MEDTRAYIKLYIDGLSTIIKLTPKSRNIFLGILHYVETDNTVDISSYRRSQLLQSLNMKKQTFSNGLVELKSVGILQELGRNYYFVDPIYIARPE